MTANTPSPAVEVIPPLPARLTWSVLLAGVGVCAVVGLIGIAIDWAALNTTPSEPRVGVTAVAGGPGSVDLSGKTRTPVADMADRLKWARGEAGPASQGGSVGELRKLQSEIGKTTPLRTVRIGLVGLGTLAAACGLWMRGGADYRGWLLAAAAGWLGGFGMPLHWDSMRLVLWVAGTAAAAGGLLAFAPPRVRFSLVALAVLFHFGGILTATTWPDTQGRTPWLTNQSGIRVYNPYFRFMYLSNAYHFYSPDPGPASEFFILIEYEVCEAEKDPQTGEWKPVLDADGTPKPVIDPTTDKPQTTAEWVDLPKRRVNYRDPLGMTYYRRLSVTELASYSTPGTGLPPGWEKAAVMTRRTQNELDVSNPQRVPGATSFGEVDLNQYRLPHTPTRRAVFPSYARHIAAEYGGMRPARDKDNKPVVGADGKPVMLNHRVTGMKMFRVEHRIIEAPQFLKYDNPDDLRAKERDPSYSPSAPIARGGLSPYHPAVYAPYYLGEYAPDGTLKNPNDPLLYWLVPVQPLPGADKNKPGYDDFMSKYAGREFPWGAKE